MFRCCERRPNFSLSNRLWKLFTGVLTLVTSILLLLAVLTDNWDEVEYFFNEILNDPKIHNNPCVNVTNFTTNQALLIKTALPNSDGSCSGDVVGTIVAPENGGMWRNCLLISQSVMSKLKGECYPIIPDRCLYYLGDMNSLCCSQCQYNEQTFKDLDDQGKTSYGTHFSTISFVIVALMLHGVCYVLILIVLYRRIVPVVMMTGIMFVLSAAFLTFALAANSYKISSMNSRHWVLPHVSDVMASHRKVREGWSMTVSWCAVLFSCFSSITWIRLSYQMASISNKIKPLVTSSVPQPMIVVDVEPPTTNGVGGSLGNTADRMVQWAKRRASHAARKSIPNGNSQANLMEGHF